MACVSTAGKYNNINLYNREAQYYKIGKVQAFHLLDIFSHCELRFFIAITSSNGIKITQFYSNPCAARTVYIRFRACLRSI